MKARANTRVTILRGTTTDTYGDTTDLGKPVATGVTAYIGPERAKVVTTAKDVTPRVVRYHPGRLPAGTDVRAGDRIRDERTGRTYLLDSASDDPTGPARASDRRLDLRRIT